MPITVIQRRAARPVADAEAGTQQVDQALALGNPTIVEFDPSLFTAPGVYTLFTFSSLTPTDATTAAGYLQGDAQSLTDCRLLLDSSYGVGGFQVTFTGNAGGAGYITAKLR